MKDDVVIILAEDDEGHATLIKNGLKRTGIKNKILHHRDGEETLDFLFSMGTGNHLAKDTQYVLLLDIHMPRVDGIETLRQIKSEPKLEKIPVIMLTTTDDPQEIERCYELGCTNYIIKPIEYREFVETIKDLGHVLNETIRDLPPVGFKN